MDLSPILVRSAIARVGGGGRAESGNIKEFIIQAESMKNVSYRNTDK